jgi:hypothetical protein
MQPSRGDDSGTGEDKRRKTNEECAVLDHEQFQSHPVEDQAQ